MGSIRSSFFWWCFIYYGILIAEGKDSIKFKTFRNLEELEIGARKLLQELDLKDSKECNIATVAAWKYESNITEENKKIKSDAEQEQAKWLKLMWQRVMEWKTEWPKMSSSDLKRQFKKLSVLGSAALSQDEYKQFTDLITEMQTMYSTARSCDYNDRNKCDLSLEPDITRVFQKSQNYDELMYYWEQWREVSGKKMRKDYIKYVQLSNKAAKLNDFDNMGEMWVTGGYESTSFRQDLARIFEELRPLYEQVHAYARRNLRKVYGESKISKRGPIPAHILGNMWSQSWEHIYDDLIPYPLKTKIDVTNTMKEKGYNAQKMFELSEDFFVSLNLTEMPMLFWKNSILEKPKNRELVCHASAWDFCSGKDFRIKQCTDVTMTHLITAHHEMGHIQYFLQYKHLPAIFRTGANPGFHEAVGDVLALSVATPKHLHKIGLLNVVEDDYESDINFLLKMALSKVVFLPFAYLMDLWRWDVFSGKTEESDLNCDWWKLRVELQGIQPPRLRTEDQFDPGAKYHIPGSVPYIRYLVSFIVQFQFHKALCMKAGEYSPNDPEKPMHKCDIYNSKIAGNALGDMLKLGASKPWPDALEAVTGTREMSGKELREYFKPLEDWLKKDNKKHNEFVGWEHEPISEYCIKSLKSNEIDSSVIKSSSSNNLPFSLFSYFIYLFFMCFYYTTNIRVFT